MTCIATREALSAGMDGEAAGLSDSHVQAHLDRCAGCRDWQEQAHALTRRARIDRPAPDTSLHAQVVAAVREDRRRRRTRRQWVMVAAAVAFAGLLQAAATVPLLVLARHAAGRDAGHWLGLAEALVGAAFFTGALVVLWHDRRQQPSLAVVSPAGAREGDTHAVSDVA
jgi:predicted anti-sigma-YlaC factor YlaD